MEKTREKEYSFTTGQFARLDKSYRKHCGPTAILNLVFTLAGKEGKAVTDQPEDVFRNIKTEFVAVRFGNAFTRS